MKPLSVAEVKKDIKEFQSCLEDTSDSDSGVLSDDVQTARFPVKPRKTFKIPKNIPQIAADASDDERDEQSLDEVMQYLNHVEKAHSEIAEAERQREALDVTFQVWYYIWYFLKDFLQ